MMDVNKSLILFLATSANLFLLLTVMTKGRRNQVHFTFGVLLFALTGLTVSIYLVDIYRDTAVLKMPASSFEFIGRLPFAFGAFFLGAFLAFADVFPKPIVKKNLHLRLAAYYGVGLIFVVLSLTNAVQKGVYIDKGLYKQSLGVGVAPYCLFIIYSLSTGITYLLRKYRWLRKGYERNQLKYTFAGFLVLLPPVLTVNLILPLFGVLKYADLTPAFSVVMVILISYAIIRHRLMNLGVVFRNSLIFMFSAVVMSVIVITLMELFESVFRFPETVAVFLATIPAVVALMQVRDFIVTVVDQYIFKGRYDYHEAITGFSESIRNMLEMEELQKYVVDNLSRILQTVSGSMYVYHEDKGIFTLDYSRNVPPAKLQRVIGRERPLVRELLESKSIVVKDELKRSLNADEYEKFEDDFEKLDAAVVAPLISRGKTLGFITLGEKISEDIYSAEDIHLLYVLGNQSATALENSGLFSEILKVKNHLQAILEHMISGVVAIDTEQRIVSINRSAIEILNLKQERLARGDASALGRTLRRILLKALKSGESIREEEILLNIKGKGEVPLGVSATPLTADGNVFGALLVFNDLSDLKSLQAEIRRSDRLAAVGTLAASMAHEIRNPLVSLKTFSQLLPERFDDEKFRDSFADMAMSEVDRINSIVDKLLNFSRPIKPAREMIDVHRLIEKTLQLLGEEISENNIVVECNFAADEAEIYADPDQIMELLINLVRNAIQAIETDGTIRLSTRYVRKTGVEAGRSTGGDQIDLESYAGSRMFVIEVEDNGKGIAQHDLGQLFDPFFTTRTSGFGLGLSIVDGIVQEHNGTINVKSTEGKGATFIVELPVTTVFSGE